MGFYKMYITVYSKGKWQPIHKSKTKQLKYKNMTNGYVKK